MAPTTENNQFPSKDFASKFKKEEWEPESSSGYTGYRNTITREWIYQHTYDILSKDKESSHNEAK